MRGIIMSFVFIRIPHTSSAYFSRGGVLFLWVAGYHESLWRSDSFLSALLLSALPVVAGTRYSTVRFCPYMLNRRGRNSDYVLAPRHNFQASPGSSVSSLH